MRTLLVVQAVVCQRFWASLLVVHQARQLLEPDRGAATETGLQKVTFLAFGSLVLRFILHQAHTYVLPRTPDEKPRKLLLCEDVPLSAQLWEMALNAA